MRWLASHLWVVCIALVSFVGGIIIGLLIEARNPTAGLTSNLLAEVVGIVVTVSLVDVLLDRKRRSDSKAIALLKLPRTLEVSTMMAMTIGQLYDINSPSAPAYLARQRAALLDVAQSCKELTDETAGSVPAPVTWSLDEIGRALGELATLSPITTDLQGMTRVVRLLESVLLHLHDVRRLLGTRSTLLNSLIAKLEPCVFHLRIRSLTLARTGEWSLPQGKELDAMARYLEEEDAHLKDEPQSYRFDDVGP